MGLINSKVSGRKKNEQTTEIMDDLEPEVKEVDSDVIVVTEEKEDVPEPSQKIPRKRRSEVENLEIPEDIPEAAPLKKSSGKSMPRKRRSEAEQFQAKKKFESEGRQKKPARRSSKSAVDEIDENETSSDENSSDSTPKFSRIVPRKRRSEESKGRPKKPARRSGINVKVDEEDTSSDEDSSTPKSSKRSPPSTIKRRSSYTLEEEEEAWNEILKIIYDAETDTWKTTKVALKGNRFWEDFIEEHDSSRTVSSWNTHFRKYTYPNLYKMPFDWEQKVNMYMCLQIPVTDEARRALEQEGNIKLVLDAIDRIWKWKPKPKTSEQ